MLAHLSGRDCASVRREAKYIAAAGDPGTQVRPTLQIEATLGCEPRVGEQRNVGDREGARGEPVSTGKLAVHQIERLLATLNAPRLASLFWLTLIEHVKAADRDVWLVAILLPE
jgi:hypothetical protein